MMDQEEAILVVNGQTPYPITAADMEEAGRLLAARVRDLEQACQQVIGGALTHRRADEVARWILTGHTEGA